MMMDDDGLKLSAEKYDVVVPEFHMSALPNFGSTTIR